LTQDFGERDSQGVCGLCQSKKVDCALASIGKGRAVRARAVCCALGVPRSHVLAKKYLTSDLADRRRSTPRAEDIQVKQVIADKVHKRATYGYQRGLGDAQARWLCRHQPQACSARQMLAGCCLGKVKSPWTPESTKSKWPSSKATRVGVQMGWNCLVTTVNASEWRLHWTVAKERS